MPEPTEFEKNTVKAYLLQHLPSGTEVTDIFYRPHMWEDYLFVRVKINGTPIHSEIFWNQYFVCFSEDDYKKYPPLMAINDPLVWPDRLDMMIKKIYKDYNESIPNRL